MCSAKGKTAQEAFDAAVAQARHEYGHGGYTGTIAEKQTFVTLKERDEKAALALAEKMLSEGDPLVNDKWGPAGCIRTGIDSWLFFGWASE